jgi:hypothetical protein
LSGEVEAVGSGVITILSEAHIDNAADKISCGRSVDATLSRQMRWAISTDTLVLVRLSVERRAKAGSPQSYSAEPIPKYNRWSRRSENMLLEAAKKDSSDNTLAMRGDANVFSSPWPVVSVEQARDFGEQSQGND